MFVYLLVARRLGAFDVAVNESRTVRALLRLSTLGVLFFLYLPIVVLAVYAFNTSRIQTWPPVSFTLKWFAEAAANPSITKALG